MSPSGSRGSWAKARVRVRTFGVPVPHRFSRSAASHGMATGQQHEPHPCGGSARQGKRWTMTDARLPGHLSSADLAGHLLDGARTPLPPDGLAHLRHCVPCRERCRAFERVRAAARAGCPDEPLVTPPARVWEAILAEASELAAGRPAVDAGHRGPV